MNSFNLDYFKKKLQINQYAEIRIISDSMYPLILNGEILKVIQLPKKLKRFDIIVFDYHGEPYCHFFWSKIANNDSLCTRSLKTPQKIDLPIKNLNLVGIVTNKKITSWQKFRVYFLILWHCSL
jgi:signal peptidase I